MALILLVEDDLEIADLVSGRLREAGYELRHAADGLAAIEHVQDQVPDLVLLDIMLPGIDGLEVCRRLRSSHPLLYIIMLTAKGSEMDRVVGLEVGADDYVIKPFSLEELVARIRSALRRVSLSSEASKVGGNDERPIEIGRLSIDTVRREVRLGAESVHLTVREYDLLAYLARHPDRPFTRVQLLADVWDIHYEGYDRTIDSHVQRLRAKIEPEPANPRYIKTVWGIGYKLAADADAP